MELIIDHKIRDWVFIPLLFVMFMVSVFRHYLAQYQNNKKVQEKVNSTSAYQEMCVKALIQKSQTFQKNSILLTENAQKSRKFFLSRHGDQGYLKERANIPPKDPMAGMMNQNMMTGMLQNNLSMGVSMALQYGWVSYLFSGFITGKVPFPLTQKFRGMLQKGVEVINLNVGYVSSLSLYFMVVFGLGPLLRYIFSDSEEEFIEVNDMQKMVPGGMGGMGAAPGGMPGMPGQQVDYNKLLMNERDSIECLRYKSVIEESEKKCINRLKRDLKME